MIRKKHTILIALLMAVLLGLSGCKSTSDQTDSSTTSQVTTTDEDGSHATKNTVTIETGDYSDKDMDDSYDESSATKITCDSDQISIDGTGAAADGQIITITKEGTYIVSGTLSDGQIIVNASEKNIQIVLDNANITCSSSAPIYVQSAKNTFITLAEDSENYISDGTEYSEDDEASAAIYSKDDLTFNGSGKLEVVANYNNAIQSKDDLKFISGTYNITSADDGIVGKDSISILDGTFIIDSQSDGIKSTNTKESDKGYIMIDGGDFTITSENDAIQAETLLYINDGTFDITAGGGYENGITTAGEGDMMPGNGMRGGMERGGQKQNFDGQTTRQTEQAETDTENTTEANDSSEEASEETTSSDSYKGLKSYVDLTIEKGTFSINSADDAIHSNNNVTIDGGTYTMNAGDDALHADQGMTINSGDINIENCYEGIEGCAIEINDGTINLVASDDGMNSVNGDDESNGQMDGGMDADDGSTLNINGGTIKITASGDGLDSNGSMSMSGGTVTVQGPTNGGNGSFDYNGSFTLTGGTLYACGSSQMAQSPSDDTTQGYISGSWSNNISAGTIISLSDENGDEVASFTTEVESQWFCLSDSKLESGKTYTLNVGGSTTEVTVK